MVDLLLTRFDDLTPYYQEQLGRLSGQMRLVVAELAHVDHPLHVAELAERIGVSQRSLGKTVSDLADRGWVAPVSTPVADLLDGRRTYYELAEPLARLSFQIKESRGEPLRLVVDFLKGWFDPDEMTAASTLQAVAYLEMARDGFSSSHPRRPPPRALPVLGPALECSGVSMCACALAEGTPRPCSDSMSPFVNPWKSAFWRRTRAQPRCRDASRVMVRCPPGAGGRLGPPSRVLVASEGPRGAAVLVEWLAQRGASTSLGGPRGDGAPVWRLDSVSCGAFRSSAYCSCTRLRGSSVRDLARDQRSPWGGSPRPLRLDTIRLGGRPVMWPVRSWVAECCPCGAGVGAATPPLRRLGRAGRGCVAGALAGSGAVARRGAGDGTDHPAP